MIAADNRSEFTGKAIDEWAYRNGMKPNFVGLGKPAGNTCAENLVGM
jgi:putative transposase